MSHKNSLCGVHWRLGQALMPGHFQRQEEALRNSFEVRFGHRAIPTWGVAALEWDAGSLKADGKLRITRLQLVLEDGKLVDVPGNASSVSLKLGEAAKGPIDVYLEVSESPIRSDVKDQDGGYVEVLRLELTLTSRAAGEPGSGFRLARFRGCQASDARGKQGSKELAAAKQDPGYTWDASYVPPLISLVALPDFATAFADWCASALSMWRRLLRDLAYDEGLAVNKRVEVQLYLRAAHELGWYFAQVAPMANSEESGVSCRVEPLMRAHPFEVFERLVGFYLDVFSFRATPAQILGQVQPLPAIYRHEQLAECFAEIQGATDALLKRPVANSGEQPFKRGASGAMICLLPEEIREGMEVYFLVQFKGPAPAAPHETAAGIDRRLDGLRLAEPNALSFMEQRAIPGIPLERVRLVPFPHNFDTSVVQFYRLGHGALWSAALAERRIGYFPGQRDIDKSFVYWPRGGG